MMKDLSRESGARPRVVRHPWCSGSTRLVLWNRGAWAEETRREGEELEKGRVRRKGSGGNGVRPEQLVLQSRATGLAGSLGLGLVSSCLARVSRG